MHGDLTAALPHLQRAVELQPEDADTRHALGRALLRPRPRKMPSRNLTKPCASLRITPAPGPASTSPVAVAQARRNPRSLVQ